MGKAERQSTPKLVRLGTDPADAPKPKPFSWRTPGGGVSFRPLVSPAGKLPGKEWVPLHFARRREELLALGSITEVGKALHEESKTATDCKHELSVGYCINVVRELEVFEPKSRGLPKQSPK